MLFNSYPFVFLFLPLFMVGYQLMARSQMRDAVPAFIIIGSIAFYAWWNWHYVFLFLFSIAFNYSWGLALRGPGERRSLAQERLERWMLAIGIAVNVILLAYFKYRNFLADSVNTVAGTHFPLPAMFLPLAISFFTFEQITYLTGIHSGEVRDHDFLSYGLFISFFPHLIAGPIVRYQQINPQFNRNSKFGLRPENLVPGFMIFAIGLFKKVILADTFRAYVNPIFDSSFSPAPLDAWGATLAFTRQVYFDFSGYTDMAVGLARLFNVEFPENFDSPYKTTSMTDLWRRWHMTLSFFLRDYVYIPLGGNRVGKLRHYFNLFSTMAIAGLWHGANWTFVLFGVLQGIVLSVNHYWHEQGYRLPPLAGWALTFATFATSLTLFRAQTVTRAAHLYASMFGLRPASIENPFPIGKHALVRIGLALLMVWLGPNRQAIMKWEWHNDYLYAAAFAALAGVSLMKLASPPAFVYFQF